jgi:hypothetical protein
MTLARLPFLPKQMKVKVEEAFSGRPSLWITPFLLIYKDASW